ncbi:MAG TPA: fumarylacetoacetate hydrolase family protein [Candidatus Binatia bacterium]|jgi:2-keto-4-pentenoate hydratase/2-oxohepta-3-ene-1,7-dioic acid hydratase in catechol pathway
MKLATFTHGGKTRIGAVVGDEIADLTAKGLPSSMLALLEGEEAAIAAARAAVDAAPRLALSAVRLEAPIARPPKILAVGLNYRAHAEECGMPIPVFPVIFNKQSTSASGPFDLVHRPRESVELDYEGELAVVIGKRCRRVPAAKARSVVAGYAVANDVSVRDWQIRVPTMTMGKSWDTHCPFGPWITTRDEIADPHALDLKTWVNGELRQNANTSDLIFNTDVIIEHLSTAFTLEPGDVIVTGTPSGVGLWMNPKGWIKDGDVVRIEIAGLGAIENRIVDEPEGTVRY